MQCFSTKTGRGLSGLRDRLMFGRVPGDNSVSTIDSPNPPRTFKEATSTNALFGRNKTAMCWTSQRMPCHQTGRPNPVKLSARRIGGVSLGSPCVCLYVLLTLTTVLCKELGIKESNGSENKPVAHLSNEMHGIRDEHEDYTPDSTPRKYGDDRFGEALMGNMSYDTGRTTRDKRGEKTGMVPSMYVNSKFLPQLLDKLNFSMRINVTPGAADAYWTNMFQFVNPKVHGYIRTHTHREGLGMFSYGTHGASDCRDGDRNVGAKCGKVNGSDDEFRCDVMITPVEGNWYAFVVENEGDGWYKARVHDYTDQKSFKLGSIQVGVGNKISGSEIRTFASYEGYENLDATCMDEPYSRMTMKLPTSGSHSAHLSGIEFNDCDEFSRIIVTSQYVTFESGIGNSQSGRISGSGGCLTVDQQDQSRVLPYKCNGSDSQNWVHAKDQTLRAQVGCLTARLWTDNRVIHIKCDGGERQRWVMPGNGTIRVGDMCLTAPEKFGSSPTVIPCNNNATATQQWSFLL